MNTVRDLKTGQFYRFPSNSVCYSSYQVNSEGIKEWFIVLIDGTKIFLKRKKCNALTAGEKNI